MNGHLVIFEFHGMKMTLIKSLYNFPLLRIAFRSRVYKTAITEIHRDDPLLTPRAAQRVLQKICAFGRSNSPRRLKSPSAEAPSSEIHFFRLPFCSIFRKESDDEDFDFFDLAAALDRVWTERLF